MSDVVFTPPGRASVRMSEELWGRVCAALNSPDLAGLGAVEDKLDPFRAFDLSEQLFRLIVRFNSMLAANLSAPTNTAPPGPPFSAADMRQIRQLAAALGNGEAGVRRG